MYRSVFADEIAAVIGDDATMALCEAYPGIQIYIPYKPSMTITKIIGAESADKLSKEYGGTTITPPKLLLMSVTAKHAAVRADRAGGLSATQIARKYNYCLRHVWNILTGQDIPESNLSFNF